jgi:hypothetical protein
MKQNDFISMLLEMRSGKVAADISEKLNELVDAIRDVGKGGSITVKLDIKPKRIDMHEGVKDVEVDYKVALSKPERHRGSSIFYLTNEGALTRTDPAQTEMFEQEQEEVNG